jgi:membrane-associated phospholipid phosphatase
MYKYGIVEDYNLINRRDRLIPNLTTTCTYLLTYVLFKYVNHLSGIIVLPILYISISLIIFTVISFFWKISAHATGATGALGFWATAHYFIPQQNWLYPLLAFTVLVGALLSARLYLGRHTAAQVWAGFALGFTVACAGLINYFY